MIIGGIFAKSALLWKCHALYVLPIFYFSYLLVFQNFVQPIVSIYVILTIAFVTFARSALLLKYRALHGLPDVTEGGCNRRASTFIQFVFKKNGNGLEMKL